MALLPIAGAVLCGAGCACYPQLGFTVIAMKIAYPKINLVNVSILGFINFLVRPGFIGSPPHF